MTALFSALDEIADLYEFFGASPANINYFSRYIAVNLQYRPNWLKKVHKLEDYPRYGFKEIPEDSFFLPLPKRKHRDLSQDIIWVVENLKKNWALEEGGIRFETLGEATLFKLKRL